MNLYNKKLISNLKLKNSNIFYYINSLYGISRPEYIKIYLEFLDNVVVLKGSYGEGQDPKFN